MSADGKKTIVSSIKSKSGRECEKACAITGQNNSNTGIESILPNTPDEIN